MVSPHYLLLAIACSLLGISAALGQTPRNDNAPEPRITELIRKLGSSSYLQRETARKELEAIGIPALEALRQAKKSADVEAARSIADLIRRAEEKLLTQQVLVPKEIHLKLQKATVDEGIAELTRLSGYTVQFQGDRLPFADKKITIDTGKTSFWQALDRFCEQAGLMEKIDLSDPRSAINGRGRMNRIVIGGPPTPTPTAVIFLTNAGKEKSITSYAGAVKSQLRVSRDAESKDVTLQLIVSVEPKLLNSGLAGTPSIEKAVGQAQQKLETTAAEMPKSDPNTGLLVLQRHTQIRLKSGGATPKLLKELAGKLTLQVDLANETVARVDKILEGVGKSAAGANGGTLKVMNVRKVGDDIEVQVCMENLAPNPLGGNVIINGGGIVINGGGNVVIQNMVIGRGGIRIGGGGGRPDVPDLIDAKGQKFRIENASSDGTTITNNNVTQTATILYRPHPDQAAPSALVLYGLRTHTIAVPFRFEDVPLP